MKMKQISVFVLTLLVISLVSMTTGKAAPQLNQMSSNTSSTLAFDFTKNYGFQVNISWSPTILYNISLAYFESNHSGTAANYTVPSANNNTVGLFWYNLTNPGVKLVSYRWWAKDTDDIWNVSSSATFEINKTDPNVRAYTRSDAYISLIEDLEVFVNMTGGADVKIEIQKPSGTENYTATWNGPTNNYTFNISNTQLGSGQSNISSWINITIYTGGTNYTEVSNATTKQLNFTYATTNAITVTIPASTTSGSDVTAVTNYTTTESLLNLITRTCSISIYDSTYTLGFSGTQQTTAFTAAPSSPGNYFTYTMTCSNISYETQTATGTVFIGVSSGSDGGGSGGQITTTQPTAITTYCGNGICETGESFWNCMKDCPLTFGEPQSIGESNETEPNTGTTISTTALIVIIVVGYLLLRKR